MGYIKFCYFFIIFIFSASLFFGNEEFVKIKEEEMAEIHSMLENVPKRPPDELLEWLRSKNIITEEKKPKEVTDEKGIYFLSLQEAICATLNFNWSIDIADIEIKRRFGAWQEAAGPFDPVFTSSLKGVKIFDAQQPGLKTDEEGAITSLNMTVQKLTRAGTRFALETNIEKVHDPSLSLLDPFTRFNESTLSFFIEQPILRNWIYNQESVNEIIASLEFDVAKYEYVQSMAEEIFNVVQVYWELVAAKKIEQINNESIRILETLSEATYRLVKGEQYAAAELNEQIAEIARSKRDLYGSIQDVYNLFNQLHLQMGERQCAFPEELPFLFLDQFPTPIGGKEAWILDMLLNQAYLHRGDLIAARARIQETDLQVRLAWGLLHNPILVSRRALRSLASPPVCEDTR